MQETTVVTRRDIRGYPDTDKFDARAAVPDPVEDSSLSPRDVEDDAANDPVPDNWEIMQAVNNFRKQIYSAFMAVNLILSGLDLQWMCDGLRDSSLKLSLAQQNLNPNQIGDLVCYSARYGVIFDSSTFQILDKLTTTSTALLLAVQSNMNATTATAQVCSDLTQDTSLYTTLHIDYQGIYKLLCTGVANGTTVITSSSTLTSVVSGTAGASSGAVTYTSWGVNGSVIVTGTAVGVSWSNGAGTGGATATLTGSSWSFGGGNVTGTAGATSGFSTGTAASASWSFGSGATATSANGTAISASWSGGNATASAGRPGPGSVSATGAASSSLSANGSFSLGATASGATSISSFTGNNTLAPTTASPGPGTAASWSFGASGNGSAGATAPIGSQAPTTTSPGAASPTWSWTTITGANGSVVVSGTAAVTASGWSWGLGNSTGLATATGGVGSAAATWTTVAGNASTVFSYSGVAWTSWIVGTEATIAVVTGTAASIDWGSASASAMITGAGQAATFTIYQITKTIYVTATAIAQTWSVYSANTAGVISATGTSGTWTCQTQSSATWNASASASGAATASSVVGTGLSSMGSNETATEISPTATSTFLGSGSVSISGFPTVSGIPFVPENVTATDDSSNSAITTSGFTNFTSSAVGPTVTAWPGNTTAVINATTIVASGESNVSTTVIGTITWSGPATVGTGLVTVTNPENGTNVTLSLTSPIPSTPKSFSYPSWTTSAEGTNAPSAP